MLGYLGLALLIIAYVLLNTPWFRWFLWVDMFASAILTIHAIILRDIPFILVNAFVTISLLVKIVRKK